MSHQFGKREPDSWPPANSNTQQWGKNERDMVGARNANSRQQPSHNEPTESEFDSGAKQHHDQHLFRYAMNRSKSKPKFHPLESPITHDQYGLDPPLPVNQGKRPMQGSNKTSGIFTQVRKSVLRQQGANFLEGQESRHSNQRCKKRIPGPQSRIDINCSKDFQPKERRKRQVDVPAKYSCIDLAGKAPTPRVQGPALMQVPHNRTNLPFNPNQSCDPTRPSPLKRSEQGNKTSGIFTQENGAYSGDEKGYGYGYKKYQPLSNMLAYG